MMEIRKVDWKEGQRRGEERIMHNEKDEMEEEERL